MKWLLAAAGAVILFVVVGVCAYAYFTPHLTMKRIHDAALSGDTQSLNEHVDFPRVKASLKEQIKARIDEGAAQSSNPFAALGSALAGALAEPAVDALVTSDNVARLLRGEALDKSDGTRVNLDDESLDMRYDGLDRFLVTTRGATGFTFVLEREGLLGWKLTEVRLPASWRIPNLSAPAAPVLTAPAPAGAP